LSVNGFYVLRIRGSGDPLKIYEARLRIYASHQTYPEAVITFATSTTLLLLWYIVDREVGDFSGSLSLFIFGFLFSTAKPRGLGLSWRGWTVGGTREDIDGLGKKIDTPSIVTPYGALRTPLGRIDQLYPIYLKSTVERPDVFDSGCGHIQRRREGSLPNIFMSA
jgi:hypothetical protein